MAQISTTKYAATIAGLISRINAASNLLAAKVHDMGLKVPVTTDAAPTTVAEGTAEANLPEVIATTKIEDVAAALSSFMTIRDSVNRTPEHGDTETIYAGFYPNDFTVKSKGTHSTGLSDITTATILAGYEGWTADGTKVAGTITALNAASLSSEDGEGFTADAGKATATIEIKRYKNADGTTGNVARSVTIPAGYYASSIVLTPQFRDNADQIEDILNYVDLNLSGDLTFTNKKVIYYPEANSGVDYYGNITIPQYDAAEASLGTDGRLTVTTAGWINTGTYGSAYGNLVELVKNDFDYATSTANSDATVTDQKFQITIPKGKKTTSAAVSKVYEVQSYNGSLSTSISGTGTYTPAIAINSAGNVLIAKNAAGTADLTATTTKPEDGYYVAVKSPANTGTVKSSGSLSLTNPGWISTAPTEATSTNFTVGANESAVTYVPIAAGTHTIGSLDIATADIKDGTKTLVSKDAYYIKCSTTEGYLKATNTYITLTTGRADPSGVSHDTNKFTGYVDLPAGYYPAQKVSLTDFAVTDANSLTVYRNNTAAASATKIAEKTYFTAETTVNVSSVQGVLGDGSDTSGDASSNIKTADSTANSTSTDNALRLENLTGNTKFYPAGTGTQKRYFTSFTVLIDDTLAALQAI